MNSITLSRRWSLTVDSLLIDESDESLKLKELDEEDLQSVRGGARLPYSIAVKDC
ncbi:MAG: hypothetical protein U5L09_18905 [Bacteroidales bacterium]|nr:hypothetical protein [Bacteroidales bacterium]